MKNLGFVGFAIAALAVSGCGGGGSTTPTPSPTAAPTVAPTPGIVTVAYTTTFGATGSAANAQNVAIPAPSLTVAVTAAQANYTGSFTAVSSCPTLVTVAPATSATGAFTVTAADATTAACTVTFTGNAATATATLAATVAKPAGVVLRWYNYNYQTQSPPNPLTSSPINIVLLSTPYVLAVSEANYVGTFKALVLSAGCTPGITAVASTPAGLPAGPALTTGVAQVLSYFTVTAGPTTVLPLATPCTITAQDNYVPVSGAANPAVAISVQVTAASGYGQ